jgi:hypothetical protein
MVLVALVVIGIAPRSAEGAALSAEERLIADSLARMAANAGTATAEPTVQDILNQLGTGKNEVTDLLPAEYFLKAHGCVEVQLVAEYSGFADQNAVGWYYPGQKTKKSAVVPGAASPPSQYSFVIDSVDSIAWYLSRSSSNLYSQKAFNIDAAQHCKFYATQHPNEYVMFWEDLPFQTSDFNDLVALFRLPNGPPNVTCNIPDNPPGTLCNAQLKFTYQVISASGDSVSVDISAPGLSETRRRAIGTVDTVSYTLSQGGSYDVRVIARDDCGIADTCGKTLTAAPNHPPVATAHDTTVFLCTRHDPCIYYQAYDPDGQTLTERLLSGPGVVFAGVHSVCFTPDTSGTYHFVIEVSDPCGAADTVSFSATIDYDDPPHVTLGPDRALFQCSGQQVCVDYTVTDPDGLHGNSEQLIFGPPGAAIDTVLNRVCFTPGSGGSYTVIVQVTDSCGPITRDTVVVTVTTNQPPTITFGNDTSISRNQTQSICLPYVVADPNGYAGLIESLLVAPAGAVIDTANNRVCWNIPPCTQGAQTFIAKVTDPCGAFDLDTIIVNVAPNAPPNVAFGNDTSISRVQTPSICLPYVPSDPDGLAGLVEQLLAAPAGATLDSANNRVCWNIPPCTQGAQVFIVKVTDPCGAFDQDTIIVNVAPNAPPNIAFGNDTTIAPWLISSVCLPYTVGDPDGLAGLIESLISAPAGATIDTANNKVCWTIPACAQGSFSIIVKVIDPCGAADFDTVGITLLPNSPPNISFGNDTTVSLTQVQSVCLPYAVSDPNGLAGLVEQLISGPPGATIDTAGNKVCWNIPACTQGTFAIIAKVTDGCGATDFDTVQVTVLPNHPPDIAFGADMNISQCSATAICAPYTVSDPDGFAGLVESLISGPPGAAIDTAANKVCFTPSASGVYTIIAQVVDPCGLSDRDTIQINVNMGAPPVIHVGNDTTVFQCNAVPVCRTYTVSDPDGLTGLVEALVTPPAGTTIDTAANQICFTPSAAGSFSIIARVTDPCGSFALDTFVVHVTFNRPPNIDNGPDLTLSQCSSSQICVPYTVSDPDGLAGVIEQLVSGPSGAVLDTANNKVCFTPPVANNYTIITRVIDPCGLLDLDTVLVHVLINSKPSVNAGGDTTVLLCASGPVCKSGITATDPNGNLQSLTKTSGPGTFDPSTHTLCYTPTEGGTTCFEFTATDSCGATGKDTLCITALFNLPPAIALGSIPGPLIFSEPTQLCFPVNATDPNAGQLFTVSKVSGAGTWSPQTGRTSFVGQHCFLADTTGCYRFIFDVTDSCGLSDRDTAIYCVDINVPDSSFQVCLDSLSAINGSLVTVHARGIHMQEMGGFDFLICYDQTLLTFTTVLPDSLIQKWEYFTYRLGTAAGCPICPAGVLRVIGVADMNNGTPHPPEEAFLPKGNLFGINFYLTVNRLFIGQCAPIYFCWFNCGDNVISSRSGDTTYISYDQGDSCLAGGKTTAIKKINFCPGLVCITPPPDDRGDINLNGLAFEIGDVVLYTNFFIYGSSVWNPVWKENQILASDCNCDGIVLTIADLIKAIRIITGDDQPVNCPDVQPKLSPNAGTAQVTLVQNGDKLETWVDTDVPLAGVFVNLAVDDGHWGELNWSSEIGGLDTLVHVNGNELRAMVVDKHTRAAGIQPGHRLLFTAPLTPGARVRALESQASTADGQVVGTEIFAPASAVPNSWSLEQNYPNPFNAGTAIRFHIGTASQWDLTIYNVLGQVVRRFNGNSEAGWIEVPWAGDDQNGSGVGSGIYFARLTSAEFTATRKMMLIK